MVVGIGQTSWKSIMEYFLIQKVTGKVLAQLARTASWQFWPIQAFEHVVLFGMTLVN